MALEGFRPGHDAPVGGERPFSGDHRRRVGRLGRRPQQREKQPACRYRPIHARHALHPEKTFAREA